MKINGNTPDPLRSQAAQQAQGSKKGGKQAASARSETTERNDSVEISEAGRAMSGAGSASAPSSDRIAEIRKKVLEGAYDSVEIVGQVAHRILQSGDL
jgi:anti-sigma28 factor (negative regulator of flagellin synthesis)